MQSEYPNMSSRIIRVFDEINRVFGQCDITPIVTHSDQRNMTFLVRAKQITAIAKLYKSLHISDMLQIGWAEDLVSAAGVNVPPRLYESSTIPLVVHEFVAGSHRQILEPLALEACVRTFEVQARALFHFVPSWTPVRPLRLPTRAIQAVNATRSAALKNFISRSWIRLCELVVPGSEITSHVDWRSDNLIFAADNTVIALDWEGLALVPIAEALGYAAASFTQSWRPSAYTRFITKDALRFLEASSMMSSLRQQEKNFHVLLALGFAGAVRIAEDEVRGVAKANIYELIEMLKASGPV
jgi:hypothetical protein